MSKEESKAEGSKRYPIIELERWQDVPDNPIVLDKKQGIAFGIDKGCVYFARVDSKSIEKAWSQAVEDRGGLKHRVGWKLIYGYFPEPEEGL